MSSPAGQGLLRLEAALARLEAVAAERFQAEKPPGEVETELALMGEDRARLAAELDAASARLAAVEAATNDVGHRLGRAISAVEGVLSRPRHPDL